jgi:hypothetical protein
MDAYGRICDVIVDDIIQKDETGLSHFLGFTVWADAGLSKVISEIPGVYMVSSVNTAYCVALDARYDREFMRQEIIAQIKIHQVGEKE